MNKLPVLLLALLMSFGVTMAADADPIRPSLNPASWNRYPVVIGGTNYNSGPCHHRRNGSGSSSGDEDDRNTGIELDSGARDC